MLLFFLFSLIRPTFRPDHGISLNVLAPWYGVPLFEQVLFYLSDYSESTAISFITQVVSASKTDDDNFIMEAARKLIPDDTFLILKSEVNLGYFLPRAEMYRETARTFCGSNLLDLFSVGEKSFPNIQQLPGRTIPFEFDLTINNGNSFVYANLHNSTVADIILKMIRDHEEFTLRPIGQTEQFGIPLRGYGIEMRPFKYSMEYGVKDNIVLDSAKKHQSSLKDSTVDLINGIPASYVNVSNITDFGARFCGFLSNHKDTNLLRFLRDVTQNYPLFMEEISNSPPDVVSFSRLENLIREGKSYSLINNRLVNLEYLDVFTLLDIFNEERNIKTMLESNYRVDPFISNKLFSISFPNDQIILFNYEKDNLTVFLNDIETDPQFDYLTDQSKPFLFNNIANIRKNWLNLVMYFDPTHNTSLYNFFVYTNIFQDKIPMRLGIVPHFTLGNRLSRKVGYAFHHLARYNHSAAYSFLLHAIDFIGFNSESNFLTEPNENHFASSYSDIIKGTNYLPWEELHTLYDPDSYESQQIQKVNQHYVDSNIHMTITFLNGKPLQYMTNIQLIIYEIQKEFQVLSSVIRNNYITDLTKETALSILSRHFLTFPKFNANSMDEIQSLKITHKPLSQQSAFIEFLSQLEWNYTDEGRSTSFYILFSNNQTEIDILTDFAKNHRHRQPTMFSINPPISERLIQTMEIDMTQTTLIVDGCLFYDLSELDIIDSWSSYKIASVVNASMRSIKYKKTEVMLYMSFVAADWISEHISRKSYNEELWQIKSSASYNGNHTERINWDIIVDPFTREFQRISGIIDYLQDVVNIRLIAVPPSTLNEPFTSFYRNALTEDYALFTMLNDTTTYSSMPDMPDSWIFESMKASVDLDNILLSELNPSTHQGSYILTNIKAEGVVVSNDGGYAEGAELALFDSNGIRKADTISMRLNGYWQLAANPGIWDIALGGSRSKNIYSMPPQHLIVSNFGQKSKVIHLSINPGMEGIKIYNLSVKSSTNTTRVDVFSVASGHLYERLLKIMMLAVRNRSKYNVKFWIIKTFLSPQFKATLPIMAKKYNFSYQLVSYKWPRWVYPQYEKQRIIWGNKILFLDVLFPLDLERVIYIDADQIVRTDLIELMRMDFGNAPYAFTPFCESRKETEPFRFWKHGYWESHLKGKKYHISALFAIDLNKFRQLAAGDILRYHYNLLAPDPNSLSNLDQDLPNYAQFQLPIFSLPQNWLWCETWCSEETLDDAKTIDLCNNPLTKKPKLYVAQTMIKEWPGLDEEARNISAGPDDYEKFFFPNKTTN